MRARPRCRDKAAGTPLGPPRSNRRPELRPRMSPEDWLFRRASAAGSVARSRPKAGRAAQCPPLSSAAKTHAGRTSANGTERLLEADLDEADDRMRYIGLLQRGNLVGRKFHVHRCERVVEMVQPCCADDGRSDDGFGEQPRQRHLRPRNAARCGNLCYAVDDLAVWLRGFCE